MPEIGRSPGWLDRNGWPRPAIISERHSGAEAAASPVASPFERPRVWSFDLPRPRGLLEGSPMDSPEDSPGGLARDLARFGVGGWADGVA